MEVVKGKRIANWRAIQHDDSLQAEKARKFLAEIPDLTPYEKIFWYAFGDLTGERSRGLDEGPIPRSLIKAYGEEQGFDHTEMIIFLNYIRVMDNVYLNAREQVRESEKNHRGG
jgi:hypothetical protein